jgi:hypothetical protein
MWKHHWIYRYLMSPVRREAAGKNVETPSGIQVLDEPVELSNADHSVL